MPQFTRSWWGNKFIEALEEFTDSGRLGRGRSYARGGKVKSFKINDGVVQAEVRGSVNPYFGVYKEPLYKTQIEIQPISRTQWTKAIAQIASKASFISKLMLNEIPDNIEDAFTPLGLHLLPHSAKDFKTSCSCPDYSNPCKHIAGVYYLVAAELDQNPFLLFELRGLSQTELQAELAKTPLGMALSAELTAQVLEPAIATTYYTRPRRLPLTTTPAKTKTRSKTKANSASTELDPATIEASSIALKDYWQGAKRLPATIDVPSQGGIAAIVVKKQGDYPPFWQEDTSFIAVMEELCDRVRAKHKDVL
ncbi:MAG: SWIM zinc finger family protein [Oculatellaceae cyanobacterium Prado106]|jgi:uncharacterized Zn finger protein|nr:SWIM zinc finger family protein [Oculatellaceae cyanobacterium Prado106]